MASYKYIDTNPRFLAVDLPRLLPSTLEHALNYLLLFRLALTYVSGMTKPVLLRIPQPCS